MSGAKVAIIFGFPGVLVPCGHCFLSIFFPGGFRGRRFSVSPCGSGLFSAEVRLNGNDAGLHTVYISCCGRVSHYIQCIFCVADVFGVTYSVYFMLRMCLELHTVYISCCGRVWRYIQCIFHLVGRFEGKNGRQRPENEVGGSIECRLKGIRRLFEAIVRVAGALFDGRKTVVGAFCLHSCFRREG